MKKVMSCELRVVGSRRMLFAFTFLLVALSSQLSTLNSCLGWAANPSLSNDFASITQWLTSEVVQGLAFNAGASFSPSTEPRPYEFELDATLGVGSVPIDSKKFPKLGVVQLEQIGVQSYFPKNVPFPDFTAHIRMGLPYRMDVSFRLSDMTAPTYRLSEQTKGNGQSNILGGEMRRHFYGQENPFLLTTTVMVNYLRGRFNFFNTFSDVKLTDSFSASADNTGLVKWSLISYGVNAIGSYRLQSWIPFFGVGFNRSHGSVLAQMESVFRTDLIQPVFGQSSALPERNTVRVITGTQYTLRRFNLFLSAETLVVGHLEGQTYNVHAGIVIPLKGWKKGYYGREVKKMDSDSPFIFIQ
ncbi:MAG: hypothetical protein HY400_01095 [Elusimicrobia bacterium]|nr:hypothetical protein [Elusimicrobiota bacterium]